MGLSLVSRSVPVEISQDFVGVLFKVNKIEDVFVSKSFLLIFLCSVLLLVFRVLDI